MPTLFKKIMIICAVIIGLTIIIVPLIPKPRLSFTERQEVLNGIRRFNSELPMKIGTIGQLDKVSFVNDTLTYFFSNYGDSTIDKFYQDNYEEVRGIMKYGCLTLNGQSDAGTKLATLLDSKGIILKTVLTTPSDRNFNFVFEGKELLNFIEDVKISPTEALYTILDTHIKLANLILPIELDDLGQLQSIPSNTIKNSLGSGDKLLKIIHSGNDVVFILETQEKEFQIKDIKQVADNEYFLNEFTRELAEDPDVKEFIDMIVISHSNFGYNYYTTNHSDSVQIIIPYKILKNHSSINSLNL